ncbi:MAG: hypothetical protein M1835_005708 [Candelina submexicana]|nr:MAG: hypothetical protein M1835_005708 [Candelina submexicana]
MLDDSGSQDHRGTPEAPGRVVTLIERTFWEAISDDHATAADKVWGVAYRIEASKVQEVQAYLDIREINGYSIQYTPFHPADSSQPTLSCLAYVGLPSNPQFVGVQNPQKLAEHIYRCRGPSGENKEYLYMLELALAELSSESGDEHVKDLAYRVRRIEASQGDGTGGSKGGEKTDGVVAHKELERLNSTDEQEEME